MKYILFFLISLLVFTSCEEVIDVDLDTSETRLVIDAKIERKHFPSGEITQEVIVDLSLTTSFFEPTPTFINDAEVSLTDMNTGTVYSAQNFNNTNGQYIIVNSDFVVQNDTEYLLTVLYNNETYEATEILNPSVPIDNLFQFKNNNAFSDPEDVAINITFQDLEGVGDYYVFNIDNNNFLATDDEFIIDGESFSFDYFYEVPQENLQDEELTVYLLGSDQATNNYVDSIVELSDGSGNGPFGTVPFEIKGNIVNTTNANNYPYGYFRINEVYFAQINLVDNEQAPEKETVIN